MPLMPVNKYQCLNPKSFYCSNPTYALLKNTVSIKWGPYFLVLRLFLLVSIIIYRYKVYSKLILIISSSLKRKHVYSGLLYPQSKYREINSVCHKAANIGLSTGPEGYSAMPNKRLSALFIFWKFPPSGRYQEPPPV